MLKTISKDKKIFIDSEHIFAANKKESELFDNKILPIIMF